jgi:hypothetical protein
MRLCIIGLVSDKLMRVAGLFDSVLIRNLGVRRDDSLRATGPEGDTGPDGREGAIGKRVGPDRHVSSRRPGVKEAPKTDPLHCVRMRRLMPNGPSRCSRTWGCWRSEFRRMSEEQYVWPFVLSGSGVKRIVSMMNVLLEPLTLTEKVLAALDAKPTRID